MTSIVSHNAHKSHNGKASVARLYGRLLDDRFLLLFQCIALFLFIIGCRFWLIGKYGTDLPFWDQWDAEWGWVFKRSYDGTLTLRDLFAPHNEHRILFTRLVSFALMVVNGQWDARVQMLLNSFFYAMVGCGLFFLFARGRGYFFGLFWLVTLGLIFSCPFGWENTLAGFQSQFYFLIAFSLAAIWLMINKSPWSWGWAAGVILGFCSLFTMASGLLVPLAILCFTCLALAREWRNWRDVMRRTWPTVIVCLLILFTGAFLTTKVDGHAAYKAKGILEFANALISCLAWPWMSEKWWAVACWLPAALFVSGYLSRRLADGKDVRFLVTVVVWVVLQMAATAYSRSTLIHVSRYSDIFSLGIIFNVLCACVLLRSRLSSAQYAALFSLVVVLLAVNGLGIYKLGFNGKSEEWKLFYDIQKYRSAGFIATGDFDFLAAKFFLEIPFHDPQRLAGFLKDPALDPILPVSVRKPLPVTGGTTTPLPLPEAYNPKILSPYPWENLWPIPAIGKETDYKVTKTKGLPILRFFVYGDIHKLAVIDSQNGRHRLVRLSRKNYDWQEVSVYCPGTECRISAAGNTERILFSEPKEMGLLSLAAILLTNNAYLFLIMGLFILLCYFSLCQLKLSLLAENVNIDFKT